LSVARALVFAALLVPVLARAQSLPSDDAILGPTGGFHIDSLRVRFTHYDQSGRGYQSLAGPVSGPGSEALTVDQPQVEIVASKGNGTYSVVVPVDVISNASPHALDAITQASLRNEAGSIDVGADYRTSPTTDVFVHGGVHLEETFRSWNLGFGMRRSFADDNTVIAISGNQIVDWFDHFAVGGLRLGRVFRSTSNGNLDLTQLLSPTTYAVLEYGVTVQTGTLGNTWNAVPVNDGTRGDERMPSLRHRHAFSGRLVQGLPWQAALHGSYRFYVDNWGLVGNTIEGAYLQRLTSFLYLRGTYRFHHQSGVDFFTTLADPAQPLRTADSDLQRLDAQTFGILAASDLRFSRHARALHLDVGYERYFRSNDLGVNMYTCSLGLQF
jgi:hypothetical protein